MVKCPGINVTAYNHIHLQLDDSIRYILNGEDILHNEKNKTPGHLIPLVLCHTWSFKVANFGRI